MHFLSLNMRKILVLELFDFAKHFRFSSFAPPSSVRLYCLFYIMPSKSYKVTFQSSEIELFQNIIHDSN